MRFDFYHLSYFVGFAFYIILGLIAVFAAYCYRPSSVVCRSAAAVSPSKTAQPIEMSFRLRTRMGPKNRVLDGSPAPLMGMDNFEG